LALPIWFQLSRLAPSNSVVYPALPCAGGQLEQPKAVKPITSNPATTTAKRFIAISSPGPKNHTGAPDYPACAPPEGRKHEKLSAIIGGMRRWEKCWRQ